MAGVEEVPLAAAFPSDVVDALRHCTVDTVLAPYVLDGVAELRSGPNESIGGVLTQLLFKQSVTGNSGDDRQAGTLQRQLVHTIRKPSCALTAADVASFRHKLESIRFDAAAEAAATVFGRSCPLRRLFNRRVLSGQPCASDARCRCAADAVAAQARSARGGGGAGREGAQSHRGTPRGRRGVTVRRFVEPVVQPSSPVTHEADGDGGGGGRDTTVDAVPRIPVHLNDGWVTAARSAMVCAAGDSDARTAGSQCADGIAGDAITGRLSEATTRQASAGGGGGGGGGNFVFDDGGAVGAAAAVAAEERRLLLQGAPPPPPGRLMPPVSAGVLMALQREQQRRGLRNPNEPAQTKGSVSPVEAFARAHAAAAAHQRSPRPPANVPRPRPRQQQQPQREQHPPPRWTQHWDSDERKFYWQDSLTGASRWVRRVGRRVGAGGNRAPRNSKRRLHHEPTRSKRRICTQEFAVDTLTPPPPPPTSLIFSGFRRERQHRCRSSRGPENLGGVRRGITRRAAAAPVGTDVVSTRGRGRVRVGQPRDRRSVPQ
jgi:hypothetical protein